MAETAISYWNTNKIIGVVATTPCHNSFMYTHSIPSEIMWGFSCILVMLCLSAAALPLDIHKYAPVSVGAGIFSTENDGLCTVHREYRRCGPETLTFADQLIECHGVFATCAEWATMQMRTDNVEGYSLRLVTGTIAVRTVGPELVRTVGLANFCRVQLQKNE